MMMNELHILRNDKLAVGLQVCRLLCGISFTFHVEPALIIPDYLCTIMTVHGQIADESLS